MKPILLEIVTRMITIVGNCHRCEIVLEGVGLSKTFSQNEFDDYPKEILDETERLSFLLHYLKELYRHRLLIRLIDAKSLPGLYKSLRHWIRNYPTFIVEGKETYTGWDKDRIETLIDKYA